MLARNYRLTAEKDYARIFSKGRPFGARGVGMKVVRNGLETARVGFVVSTKVAKRAVVRNLIKRRMRDITRKRLAAITGGVDVVFMARAEVVKMSYVELAQAMDELLAKAGIARKL